MTPLLEKRRRRPEINLVPLIDVLVMLVFFAFVTMRFRTPTTLSLTLPKIETAGQAEFKGSVTVSIDKQGNLYFNGRFVTDEQLGDLLVQAHSADPNTAVLLKVDEASEVKRLTLVEDDCRKAGFAGASLESRSR